MLSRGCHWIALLNRMGKFESEGEIQRQVTFDGLSSGPFW